MSASGTLLGAADAVRSGTVSSEELVAEALARLDDTEADVGAFLSVQGRAAIEAARELDRKVIKNHMKFSRDGGNRGWRG